MGATTYLSLQLRANTDTIRTVNFPNANVYNLFRASFHSEYRSFVILCALVIHKY